MEEKNNDKILRIIITSIVIIILLFAIIIGVVFTINSSKEPEEIENKTEEVEENTISQQQLNEIAELEKAINNTIEEDETVELSRKYAKIQVVWVDKKNNIILEPLKPILNGMTPVKYSSQIVDFVETTENDKEWYNYDEKRWANAVDNGSYFVWIPRFAYKIEYYSDSNYSSIIGYCDYRGIYKINSDDTITRIYSNNQGLTEVGNHYILAPAFAKDTSSGYRNGGWDTNLSGFWVSKYEMSMETNGKHTETSSTQIGNVLVSDSIKAVSKQGVSSWRNITVGNCYLNAFNYNRDLESHLIKNSEWGAVAYLSYSKYGTNGKPVTVNKDTNCITGGDERNNGIFIYNENQTTTGNNTGVYDFSGGAYEYSAAFINNGYIGLKENGGTAEGNLCENAKNTKYKTVYTNIADDRGIVFKKGYSELNYMENKLRRGDAIFETSTSGYGTDSWGSTSSYFVQEDTPFFTRGGDFANQVGAGIFSFNSSSGRTDVGASFRVILACE